MNHKVNLHSLLLILFISCTNTSDKQVSADEKEATQPAIETKIVEMPADSVYAIEKVIYKMGTNKPYTGLIKKGDCVITIENGSIIKECTFHENGQIFMERNYKNNLFDGIFREYAFNGNQTAEEFYKKGIMIGFKTFDNGKVVQDKQMNKDSIEKYITETPDYKRMYLNVSYIRQAQDR